MDGQVYGGDVSMGVEVSLGTSLSQSPKPLAMSSLRQFRPLRVAIFFQVEALPV